MARQADDGTIRRSRLLGWFGAVTGCAVVAALPGLAIPAESVHVPQVVRSVLTHVPAAVLALLLGAPFLELRRSGSAGPSRRTSGLSRPPETPTATAGSIR